MLASNQIEKILTKRPKPNSIWFGEPNFGSYYTISEINSLKSLIIKSNLWDEGFGPRPKEIEVFERNFANFTNVSNAIAVSNNGDGFEMVLRTIDLKKNDEVITPSLNFKAWLMVMHKFNLKVKFCDVDVSTLNMNIDDLEKKITSKTRIICPVHMGGISCDTKGIDEIARYYSKKFGRKIYVIYDSARAVGVHNNAKPIGCYGDCEIFSFHGAKLMTTLGEGGMITTNNRSLSKKLFAMRSYGDEKTWGMNYRMTKIGAFMGNLQLKRINKMNMERIKISNKRIDFLKGLSEIDLPEKTKKYENIFYLFPILLKKEYGTKERDKIINYLEKKHKIVCSIPKHINKRWDFVKKNYGIPNLPNTDYIYERIFCPIIHPKINNIQNKYISAAITKSLSIL